MFGSKIILAALTTSALLAVSVSSAEARWYGHRGPGPVGALVGGVIVGAATIATLPFAVLGAAVGPGPAYGSPRPYAYGPPPPPPPPPAYYRGYAPPAPYYGRRGYYGYGY